MAKKININYDVKSLEKAIQRIELIKKKFKTIIPSQFIMRCLEWIRDRANNYLDSIPMDYQITSEIQTEWNISIIGNRVGKLINSNGKAVYVEFGVGKIGQKNSHPNSDTQNYQYNIKSDYKRPDGSWVFDAQHKQYAVDLNDGYYVMFGSENTNRAKVLTKGSPSNMYLYNSMIDLITTGTYKRIWNQVLEEQL